MEEKVKILLADSDAENIRSAQAVLCSLGYDVIVASSGDEAFNKAKAVHPAVIVLDAVTSQGDTFRTLSNLKTNDITKTIPVLMMISVSGTEDRANILSAGADDFLTKPVDSAELQARMRSLVKVKAYNDHILNYKEDLEKEVDRRIQELTKALEKIKVTSLDTVYRLSRAAEYKDEDTGAHVQRMSHYSSAIARRMGLGDMFVENILWAAPMHDIGKIGIPDRVLLKPGKLDDEEWVVMRKHTTIGADILKDADADFIKLAAEIALTHHEKWSGAGYPQGLKGSDIPLAGRIVALADVFDALTSERPYKAPFPLEKALGIIKEGRGNHFDADVTDAFLAIEDEIKAEMNWWKFMASGNSNDATDLSNLFS